MIWKRAIASQMQPAEIERTTVEIEARQRRAARPALRAVGSVVRFDGFIAAYTDQKEERRRRTRRTAACREIRAGETLRRETDRRRPSTSPSRRRAIRKPR